MIEVDKPSWYSSVNTTEIEICIQNSKMGVLSDEKGPNSDITYEIIAWYVLVKI